MSYYRLARLYWRTGRAWGYAWYETVIEIAFALLWKAMRIQP
jgi:hypothetical protein